MLPFELHVLEIALGDVCQLCTQLVKELEAVSNPALDALTNYVRSSLAFPSLLLAAILVYVGRLCRLWHSADLKDSYVHCCIWVAWSSMYLQACN